MIDTNEIVSLETLLQKERDRRRVARNKPGAARKYRDGNLRSNYGITLVQWEVMFDAQGRCCAICKSPDHGGRGWCTDHCHDSERVRGILCISCNLMLGHAKDNVDTLVTAITYLKLT